MEKSVSKVLLVLQDRPVQARHRETLETWGSRVSQDPPAGREKQDSLAALDSLASRG